MLRFSVKPKLWLVISPLTASSCTSEGLLVMICVNVCSYRFSMAQRHTGLETNRVLGMKFQIKGFDHWLLSWHGLQNAAFSFSRLAVDLFLTCLGNGRATTFRMHGEISKTGFSENGISYIFISGVQCYRPRMVCWSSDFSSPWWPVSVTAPVPSCNRQFKCCVSLKVAFRSSGL